MHSDIFSKLSQLDFIPISVLSRFLFLPRFFNPPRCDKPCLLSLAKYDRDNYIFIIIKLKLSIKSITYVLVDKFSR